MHLKDRLDFDGDVARQRTHPDGTACAHTFVWSPNRSEQFAAAINDLGMFFECRRAVDHAKDLDHSLHLVQAAQMGA